VWGFKRFQRVRRFDLHPARYLNLALASWLLVSAFLWRHSEPQFITAIVVGVAVAFAAPFELGSQWVRWINMIAGLVLILGAVAMPRASIGGMVHNVIVGLVLFGMAFYGPPHGSTLPRRPEAPEDAYDVGGIH
jgi:hypothetical protein